jgi:Protein of unknown function (DUF1302)
MTRIGLRLGLAACFVLVSLALCVKQSTAAFLDKEGDIKLGVRAYVNARVGTETTHDGYVQRGGGAQAQLSATFPHSDAGHIRQNRGFIEVELNHDLDRLLKQGWGPLSLLNDLPFKIKELSYHFTFRGEADGIYDWGGNEYSTAQQFYNAARVLDGSAVVRGPGGQGAVDVGGIRKRLRQLGVDRERLFQAYVEGSVGNLFVRVGRQILSWGETDGFRLLDNINPLDSSFGGFLISLDERRVPLDMLRASYRIGDLGPLTEMFLESYVAIDNKVGYAPGTPQGSPWALPSLGAPTNASASFVISPARTINNARGGGRLVFNALDATFSLAHYYTYFDTPALQVTTTAGGLTRPYNDGQPCLGTNPNPNNCGFPAHVIQTAPKVQISGATTTFALPQFYSVVRSELAYFKGEPAFTQGQLDPFIFNASADPKQNPNTGGRRVRDSVNAVIGLDINQWIRALNPNQTFFISTQFFYKHIRHGAGNTGVIRDARGNILSVSPNREVLPIQLNTLSTPQTVGQRLEPFFVTQPINQYLQTLFIGTSYRSGTINPGFTFFYDWGGSFLYQPTISFSRDPFRFIIDYSIIDAHIYKGGSGVSLLKDRDNIQFRFEYVI